VVVVNLAEFVYSVHGLQRPDGDAGSVQVDEERGDAVVAGCGAGEQNTPGGELRDAGPDLLPVDDPVVPVLDRAGSQRRQVAARSRLGKALTPLLFAPEQAWHH